MGADQTSAVSGLISNYLKTAHFQYKFDIDELIWEAEYDDRPYAAHIYLKLYADRHELVFYIVADSSVPAACEVNIIEYLTRVNFGLIIGNFEYDHNEAKIRFKSSLGFKGSEPAMPLIRHLIEPAFEAWTYYLPGAVEVIIGVESPVDALRKLDQRTNSPL